MFLKVPQHNEKAMQYSRIFRSSYDIFSILKIPSHIIGVKKVMKLYKSEFRLKLKRILLLFLLDTNESSSSQNIHTKKINAVRCKKKYQKRQK